jgi:thiol-disulfide isomerase/thioredoxin
VKRNALVFAAMFIAILAMLATGKYLDRTHRHGAPVLVGDVRGITAPNFELATLDGQRVKLSDYRGKAVLLNFWATWCGPCKIETPWLVQLQNQYGPQGLQIIGVEAGDDGKEDIEKFVKDMGINYPILIGKESVGDAYGGVPALPETFFIGRDGKIVDKSMGLHGRAEIEDSIKEALNTETAKN